MQIFLANGAIRPWNSNYTLEIINFEQKFFFDSAAVKYVNEITETYVVAFLESQGKTHLAGITMKEVLAAAQPAKAAAMAMKLAFVHLVENSAEFTNVLKYKITKFIFVFL